MEHFTAHRLRFVTEVVTPVELNEHKGSAIRGALYHALTDGFCMNKPALQTVGCAQCPLVATCPVAFLVATLRDAQSRQLDPRSDRGANVPRPYTIEPPVEIADCRLQIADREKQKGAEGDDTRYAIGETRLAKTRYAPGERFEFGLTMFARALNVFPYVVLAMKDLERGGIGKKVEGNGWRRGRIVVREIWAENPLTGERKQVLREGDAMVQVPDVPITHGQVARRQVAGKQVTLDFLTPTRLVDEKHLVPYPDFRVLMQRLLERLSALAKTFSDTPMELDFRSVIDAARAVQLVENRTRWVEVESYSTRLGRATPIGGFVGEAVYEVDRGQEMGDGGFGLFMPWLVWGQFTHVGKDAVKGNGWYEMVG